jgi:integrase/recombinase XerD
VIMKVAAVLAPGIYKMDNGSHRVVARVGDRKSGPRPKEKRFPASASLRDMKRWQEDQRSLLRRETMRPVRGTLAADVPAYLNRMEGALQFPTNRRYEIGAWLGPFGHRRRDSIEPQEIEQQVREWQRTKVAASTIRHRLSALSKLYKELDGKRAYNPVASVERPAEPRPGANAVPLEQILKVLDALTDRVERNGRGWVTLARLRVITMTGMRHSQVMRLQPADIWLDATPAIVNVNAAGKGGRPHWKPLTEDGVAALRLFIEKNAFGAFSQSSVHKSWRRACADAGVPFFNPYRLRHSWATTLRAGGLDLADVQELIGHTSAKTTVRYAMVSPPKLLQAVGTLGHAHAVARANVTAQRQATRTAQSELPAQAVHHRTGAARRGR